MSMIDRVWGWVVGRSPEPPPAPKAVQSEPAVPRESVQLSYADPEVQDLTEAMASKLNPTPADRLRRQAVGLTVAQSQTGLAGVALHLAESLSEQEQKAAVGEAALKHLARKDPAGPWSYGLKLAGVSSYATPRWAACQQTLAWQAAGDLSGLGLQVMQAISKSNYAADRVAVGKMALGEVNTDNARLALRGGSTTDYSVPQNAIYETFLATPSGDPCKVTLQALEAIPTANYSDDRAKAGLQMAATLAEGRPALAMAVAAAKTSAYALPRRILVEAALENSELQKPQELAQLGLAMVRAIPAANYGEQAAAAADSVLKSLSVYPELEPITGLARSMMSTSDYQTPRRAIADKMLDAAALGHTPAQAAQAAFLAIPTANYGAQAAAAAQTALKALKGDPVADMALAAMATSAYQAPRLAIARVAFEAMNAKEPLTLAQTALQMLEAIPAASYPLEAVAAGTSLASSLGQRYSGARGRLDQASAGGESSREKLRRLRDAFASIQASDDDRAAILKMAEAVQGKAPPVTIEQREDAIIVGGIRVKKRN